MSDIPLDEVAVDCLHRDDFGRPNWESASGRPLCASPGSKLVHRDCLLVALDHWPEEDGLEPQMVTLRTVDVPWTLVHQLATADSIIDFMYAATRLAEFDPDGREEPTPP